MYNGNDLIREAGGEVVAVIIQYRLGLFGFLPGEKVKEGGALNAGLCKFFLFYKRRKNGNDDCNYSGSAGSIAMGAETCRYSCVENLDME